MYTRPSRCYAAATAFWRCRLWASVVGVLFCGSMWGQEAFEKRINIQFRGETLEAALELLYEKSGVPFSYSSEALPADKRITARFQRQTAAYIIKYLLTDTGLGWRVLGNQIVIYKLPPAPERKYTISGFLYDAASGEPLIGAWLLDQNSRKPAVTNAYGFFSLTLPAGEVNLLCSYLGFEQKDTIFALRADVNLVFHLNSAVTLTEVVVKAGSGATQPPQAQPHLLGTQTVERLPALGGEADLVRGLHLLPGVQTGTDGVEGLHIRGGSQGHNLVLIDGVPVYNYGHAAGIFSVFNTEAVRSVRFLKGSFPARYGGRLASVIDVRTKEGNTRTFHGRAEMGMLSSRLTLEGPIVRDKSAFFISGRTSLINWYLRPLSQNFKSEQGELGQTSYNFDDINAKLHYAFSPKDRLYLSLYKGRDAFENNGFQARTFTLSGSVPGEIFNIRYDRSYKDSYHWGNTIGSLRWNHVAGNKLFVNTTATFSRLDVNIGYENADSLLLLEPRILLGRNINVGRYQSGIEERGLRIDADYVPVPGQYWRFGANWAFRKFRPGALVYDERSEANGPNLVNAPTQATEIALYVENEFSIGKNLIINAGAHLASWNTGNENHNALQPRLSVQWQLAPRWKWRAAHSSMAQFLHFLTNSDIGLPTDLWVPSTDQIAPERAWQTETGLEWRPGNHWLLEWDVYYKKMRNLLAFAEGASFLNDWEQNVTIGEGTAYGMETLVQYRTERTTAWMAYSLGKTERRFDRINLGRPFPFKYDRRHDWKIVVSHQLRPWLTLSGNWLLSSGFAYSLPVMEFSFQIPGQTTPPVIVQDFGSKNRFRMPAYHRLDLAARFSFNTQGLEHNITVGVYNVYNRRNPLYYNLRADIENENNELRTKASFVQVWLLPVMPSFSYSLRF
jgi:outer membrane receptor for ferrienterochelin and colicin